jgi:predicted nucleic acid-binding protein
VRVFVDTNLWVYRLDSRDLAKQDFLKRWLRDLGANHEIVLSTQVLIEFRAVLARKFRPALSATEIGQSLEILTRFEVVPASTALVMDAHVLADREQLGWFDALIVEAAIRSRCSVLYSEDLGHGRRIDSLQIQNPLFPAPPMP